MNGETAMLEMFRTLTEPRQTALRSWFAVQRLIAEHSGLAREEWFGLLEEALAHPLDYGFVEETSPRLGGADPQTIQDARRLLGDETVKTGLAGEGIVKSAKKGDLERELLERFQDQKRSFETRTRARRTDGRPNGRSRSR